MDEYNVFVPDVWFLTEARRPGRDARWFEGRGAPLSTPLLPGLAIDVADLFDR